MKKEDIMRRAIGEIDDDLIEDADIDEDSPVPLRRRKPVILKRAAAAVLAVASSALLIIGGLSIGRPRTPVIHPEATSQTDPSDTGTEPDHSSEPRSTKKDTGKATDTTGTDDKKQTETDGEPSTEPAATDPIRDPVDPTVDPTTEPVTEPEPTEPAQTEPKPRDTSGGKNTSGGKDISGGKDSQKPPVTPESSHKTDPPPSTESSSVNDTTEPQESTTGSGTTEPIDPPSGISVYAFCEYLYREAGSPSSGYSLAGSDPGTPSYSMGDVYEWFHNTFNSTPGRIVGQSSDPDSGFFGKVVLATFLDNLFTALDVEPPVVREWPGFDDVLDGKWYTEHVIRMYCAGLVEPCDETTFGINDPVSAGEGANAARKFISAALDCGINLYGN
ncbi:MAG: hypothetical protein IKI91_00615 [Clostridia bacterium]|nr:hypothetical protein [Clostridia bacterium]